MMIIKEEDERGKEERKEEEGEQEERKMKRKVKEKEKEHEDCNWINMQIHSISEPMNSLNEMHIEMTGRLLYPFTSTQHKLCM